MKPETGWRIFLDRKESLLEKYIVRVISGDIKNLIIKEDCIMVERLKEQREVYVAELETLRLTDLEATKAERFELVKEQIALEVEAEHNAKIAEVELKISHYDFVIAEEEAAAAVVVEEANEVVEENEIIGG